MDGPLYGVPMKNLASLITVLFMAQACAGAPPAPEPAAAPVAKKAPKGVSYAQLIEVARKLAGLGKAEKAAKYANEAKELDPKKSGAWAVLGLLAAQKMDLDGAQALYQKAIELGCEEPEPYAELASIYDVSKDYDKAIATYQAWLAKAPDDHEMRHQMALSLLIQGKTSEGIREFETLVKAQPTNKTFLMDLGYAHLRNGSLSKAVKQFEAAQPEGAAPSLDYGLVVAVVQKMSDPKQALAFVERFAVAGQAKDKLVAHLKTLQK